MKAICIEVASYDLSNLESVNHKFHDLCGCAGGPDSKMYNIQPENAYIDVCGAWCHGNRVICCNSCKKLKITL